MKKRWLVMAGVFTLSMVMLAGCGAGKESGQNKEVVEIQSTDRTDAEMEKAENAGKNDAINETEKSAGSYHLFSKETGEILCEVYALPGYESSKQEGDYLSFRNVEDTQYNYSVDTNEIMQNNHFGEKWEWSWDYVRENGKLIQIEDGQYGVRNGGEYYVVVYDDSDSYYCSSAPHENKYDITESFLNGEEIDGLNEYTLYLLMDMGDTMEGTDGKSYPVYAIKRYNLGMKDEDGFWQPGHPIITYRDGETVESTGMDKWVEVDFLGMDNDDWGNEEYQDAYRRIFGK